MSSPASVRFWTVDAPGRDVVKAIERLRRVPDVARIAVMPDVHLAEEVCVGVVVGARNILIPAAVGGDIGCGMAAVATSGEAGVLADERVAERVLRELARAIPILRRRGKGSDLPDHLGGGPPNLPGLAGEARRQLGTVGRGNHFIELQSDEEGGLWLMAHSGSRAAGQAIRRHHERIAVREKGGLWCLRSESPEGRAYLADLEWGLAYAEANRGALIGAAGQVLADELGLELDPRSRISCHHNFVRLEEHGEPLWVHRKGSISAREGELGIVPGSMGSFSFHVEGRGNQVALESCSHGAGRRLSRTAARKAIGLRQLEREMTGVWYSTSNARALCEEAPGAYRDIGAVMRAQKELVRVVRRLTPVLNFKG